MKSYKQETLLLPRGRVSAIEGEGGAAIRIELFDTVLDATEPKPSFQEARRAAIRISDLAWGRT